MVPTLRPISLLTILTVFLLSPVVRFLEKKKVPKMAAISLVFLAVGVFLLVSLTLFAQVASSQWESVVSVLPQYAERVFEKMRLVRNQAEERLGFALPFSVTSGLSDITQSSQSWLILHFPNFLGSLASALFLVPIFSFFLLKDSKEIYSGLFNLVPHKYGKTLSSLVDKILLSMSEYIRAKFVEAFLVGLMTLIGLKAIGSPYALVFALIAAVTNIVPYLGPILGALPPILVAAFSEPSSSVWPTALVFIIVNAIDTILIFPILVGKLVNLSPLVLLISVAVGQEFYGVVGMLIAVPIASMIKIVFQEIYRVVDQTS